MNKIKLLFNYWPIVIMISLLFLLFLPLLSTVPQLAFLLKIISYLSSEDNEAYFGVVLPTLSIGTTFLLFFWKNQIDSQNKLKEEWTRYLEKRDKEGELEKENQRRYLEKRENELALVRPLFLVKHSENSSYIELFVRDKVPVKNIKIYMKQLGNENYQIILVGNAKSGQEIYSFDEKLVVSIIIECQSYVDEKIYFQYFAGDNTLHYRLGDKKDIGFTKEKFGRDCLAIPYDEYEIYDIQLRYSTNREDLTKEFMRFLKDKPSVIHQRPEINNLSTILLEEYPNRILSSAIHEMKRAKYEKDYEVFIELLGVVKKYVEDTSYTKCSESNDPNYFIENVIDTDLKSYADNFKQNGVTRNIMIQYINDLTNLMEENKSSYEVLSRNVYDYIRHCTFISSESLDDIREDIGKVFRKLIENNRDKGA